MKIIRVHWSLIREDIIEIFQDTSILKFTLNAIIINKHGIEEAQDRATGSYGKCFHCFGRLLLITHVRGFPTSHMIFTEKCGRQSDGYLLRDIMIANIFPLR